jgi:riboflavin transporter FmnP
MASTSQQQRRQASSTNEYLRGRKSVIIAGTAILGSVVGILEITRSLRIPFPLFPTLKFDIVGIPMVIAYLLFGLAPGISTSMVSFALIASRDPFSGAMKALAESVTIVGISLVLRVELPVPQIEGEYLRLAAVWR